MSEMSERIAKALRGSWPSLPVEAGDMLARAALEAMREPTEAMITAGDKAGILGTRGSWAVWKAMIDEALKSGVSNDPAPTQTLASVQTDLKSFWEPR